MSNMIDSIVIKLLKSLNSFYRLDSKISTNDNKKLNKKCVKGHRNEKMEEGIIKLSKLNKYINREKRRQREELGNDHEIKDRRKRRPIDYYSKEDILFIGK